MGCVESSDALSSDAIDEGSDSGEKPSGPAAQKLKAGKGKSKLRLKRKKRASPRQKTVESAHPKEPAETRIHVIWRRVSLFSPRRDSIKSNKSMDMDAAGPSYNFQKTLHVESTSSRPRGGDSTRRDRTLLD